jgi:hypothetical protein
MLPQEKLGIELQDSARAQHHLLQNSIEIRFLPSMQKPIGGLSLLVFSTAKTMLKTVRGAPRRVPCSLLYIRGYSLFRA